MLENTPSRLMREDPNKNREIGEFVRKAVTLRSQGKNLEAVELCVKGLEKCPLSIDLRCQLGLAFFEKGDENQARKELEEVVRTIERNHIAFHVLEKIYGHARKNGAASRGQKQTGELQDRSLLPPSLEKKTRTLADLYRKQGYIKEALNIYNGLLCENPDDPYLNRVVHELTDDPDKTRDKKGEKGVVDAQGAGCEKQVLDILESWQKAIQKRRNQK